EGGRGICTRPRGGVLEVDIRSYLDKIVRATLVERIEKRVIDGSVLRLIGKGIQVGVIEDGKLLVSETGTGQGQPISPLLANIYLHYALDEWFEEGVKPRLKGEAYEIRFADDAILWFQQHTRQDADVGEMCRTPVPVPVVATSDHPLLGGSGESRLKN